MKAETPEIYNAYPGVFVPSQDEEQRMKRLKKSADRLLHPHVYTKKLGGLYEVQVSAPGLERNEIIIYGNKTSLSIYVSAGSGFRNKSFHENIMMPENADAGLAVAEYKNSVLHLYIPKTKLPVKRINTRIVVY